MKRVARRAATIHWPAFQVAAVLEIAVFAFVEPQALRRWAAARCLCRSRPSINGPSLVLLLSAA